MELTQGEHRLLRALLVLGVAALVLWVGGVLAAMLERVANVVLLFVLAWAVAFLLAPSVTRLQARFRLSRVLAVAIVYVVLFLALILALAILVPVVTAQVAAFIQDAPASGERMAEQVRGLQRELDARGVQLDLTALYGSLPERAAVLLAERSADVLGIVGGVATAIGGAALMLILAFLMLVDGRRLWRGLLEILPPELAGEAELFRQSADRSFGGFLRVQLLLGLSYGLLTWLFLAIIQVPLATLLGVVSGLLMVIPFFGAFIALVLPLIVALPQGLVTTLVAFIGLVILQNVILNFVAPRLLAESMGIHPLFVFFALLLGAQIAGFWGLFLALPIAGILNVFFQYFVALAHRRRERIQAASMIIEQ
jgi:predicted PurR-regulated permease PerM